MKTAGAFWALVAPLTCVVVISIGQLLFKLASGSLDIRRPWTEPRALAILAVALILYAAATLLWVAALRHAPLSRLYPLMAISFVLVPLGGWLIFREPVSGPYWAGIGLILAGLAVIGRAPAA